MKKRLTEDQLHAKIKTLPVWMQDICNAALADRDAARKELASHYAEQKPSPFYTYTYDVKAGKQKQFMQTDRVVVEHAGIEMEVVVNAYGGRDGKEIQVTYGRPDKFGGSDIALLPKMHNTFELRAIENMDGYPRQRKVSDPKGAGSVAMETDSDAGSR